MFDQLGTEPPPDLLQRLANIDARLHQVMFTEFFVGTIYLLCLEDDYLDNNYCFVADCQLDL
jgi:hypothetical protein